MQRVVVALWPFLMWVASCGSSPGADVQNTDAASSDATSPDADARDSGVTAMDVQNNAEVADYGDASQRDTADDPDARDAVADALDVEPLDDFDNIVSGSAEPLCRSRGSSGSATAVWADGGSVVAVVPGDEGDGALWRYANGAWVPLAPALAADGATNLDRGIDVESFAAFNPRGTFRVFDIHGDIALALDIGVLDVALWQDGLALVSGAAPGVFQASHAVANPLPGQPLAFSARAVDVLVDGRLVVAGENGSIARREGETWVLETTGTTATVTHLQSAGGALWAGTSEGELLLREDGDVGMWRAVEIPEARSSCDPPGDAPRRDPIVDLAGTPDFLYVATDTRVLRYTSTEDAPEVLADWSGERVDSACDQYLAVEDLWASDDGSLYLVVRQSRNASPPCGEYILRWVGDVFEWL